MEKIWYLKINGKPQGPYSIEELKSLREVTPDTLVWYPPLKEWVPMRSVPELQEVFIDPETPEEKENDEEEFPGKENVKAADELVLELPTAGPPVPFWIFAILMLMILLLWHLFLRE